MAPLMLFLASSFNIELVYVILKGITQFSYLTCGDNKNEFMRKKAGKLNLKPKSSDGSQTLIINEIKIKDIDKWSKVQVSDVKENDKFIRDDPFSMMQDEDERNVLRMK